MAYKLNIAKVNKLELSPNKNNLYSLLYVIVAESVEYKPAPGSTKSVKAGTLKKGDMIDVFEETESDTRKI